MVNFYAIDEAGTGTTCGATATDVWPIWTASGTTLATAVTTATPDIWTVWTGGAVTNATATSAITAIQNEIWTLWMRQDRLGLLVPNTSHVRRAQRVQMSAEDRALNEEYERVTQAKYEEEKAKRIAAEARAELLLQRLLTIEQRESLEKKNHFYLHSAGKRYRIDRGRSGNVKLVDEKDQVIESYCIHPSGVPDADTMAAQKLLLEADPEAFRSVANITRRNGDYRPGTPQRAIG